MAWSPDSKMFAVNYWVEGEDSNSFVQAFDVKSLNSIWLAHNSSAIDLAFTPGGRFVVESSMFVSSFYWRSAGYGDVIRQVKPGDLSQIPEDCKAGGQFIIANSKNNTVLTADINGLVGSNANHSVVIRQWSLETGQCNNLIQYHGGFDIFDLNSNGNLLAYGGEGKDNSVVIWDMEKRTQVCRIEKVDFGRFVPRQNILAVIRNQKMIFVDASSCRKLKELPVSTSGTYLAFSPDGKQFAVAKDSIQIMSVSTGKMLSQIPLPQNTVLYDQKLFSGGLEFSPDGRYLLIAFLSADPYCGKIQLWRVQ
jgi:WD40 repeat protein